MSLNEEWTNTAHLLGRLFATLQKVRQDVSFGSALSGTIRDRCFGAASGTLRSVFVVLLRLVQHHIAKHAVGNGETLQVAKSLCNVFTLEKKKYVFTPLGSYRFSMGYHQVVRIRH